MCWAAGLMVASIAVLELPPRLSRSSLQHNTHQHASTRIKSTCINMHQAVSTRVNTHQVNMHQHASSRINTRQHASTRVNTHQVNMHQHASTRVKPYQHASIPSSTTVALRLHNKTSSNFFLEIYLQQPMLKTH